MASPNSLDIATNRKSRKWSKKELLGRILWGACQPFFRYSPRICWGWRNFLLRCFGANIGQHVHVDPSARIFIPWNLEIGDWSSIGFDALLYNLGALSIGNNVTISQRAHLCAGTHDYRSPDLPLVKATIRISDSAWVCADAFVGPHVTVSEGAILGARGVAMKDIPAWMIVAGNPALPIKARERFASTNDIGGKT